MVEKVLEKLARGETPTLIEVANLISIIQEKDEYIHCPNCGMVKRPIL